MCASMLLRLPINGLESAQCQSMMTELRFSLQNCRAVHVRDIWHKKCTVRETKHERKHGLLSLPRPGSPESRDE